MGNVIPLRMDEPTLTRATVRFLRSHIHRRHEAERLYDLLVEMEIVDAHGKPALLAADEDERRKIYDWLIAHTGVAA